MASSHRGKRRLITVAGDRLLRSLPLKSVYRNSIVDVAAPLVTAPPPYVVSTSTIVDLLRAIGACGGYSPRRKQYHGVVRVLLESPRCRIGLGAAGWTGSSSIPTRWRRLS